MIYRVLVDFRNQVTYLRVTGCALTGQSFRKLASWLPADVMGRLGGMKNKWFGSEEELLQALERVLSREQTHHQAVILGAAERQYTEDRRVAVPWRYEEARKMIGASYGWLATVMDERGLRAPEITNPRARFYFTERGWEQVGRFVAVEAREKGHVVKVIRRKEPDESQVIYRDELQVALLPRKRQTTMLK